METIISNQHDGKTRINAITNLKRGLRLAYWMAEIIELEQFEEIARQLKEYAAELES